MNFFKLGSHPSNLLFRFILEIMTLASISIWAWSSYQGWLGFVLAVLIPFGLALVWGVFAVPNDPSRSGKAPVPTRGWVRLILELCIFASGAACLYLLGKPLLATVLAGLVIGHYFISMDRVSWLLER